MKELAKDTKSILEGIFQTPKVEKGHLTKKQPQSRTMSKHTWARSDVETVSLMKRTTESDNGIPGVRVILWSAYSAKVRAF